MYINPLGSEIGQNHLSILKWSLNKYSGWKVWTPGFQMPCRTHFSDSWIWRSIISNEKFCYLSHGNTKDTPPEGYSPFETETFWELKIFIKENQYKSKCLRIPSPLWCPGNWWEGGVSLVLPWDIWEYFLRTCGCCFYTLLSTIAKKIT